MHTAFKTYLLQVTHATDCEQIEVIQSLWSGYGTIARYQLSNATVNTVVVKHIALNQANEHPRGWNTDFAHNRKVKSYQVETHWYTDWNQQCTDDCRVPQFLGSFSDDQDQWIILEDLDTNFPVRKEEANLSDVRVCLKWLANFHATFMTQQPDGLWQIGTYWHLETRPDELKKIEHQKLKSKAKAIDTLLNQCQFKTLVHGDAKLANFCFSSDDNKVAAVDFQYVGGGCGMKDVAYFLGSCLSGAACERYENELLDAYFSELEIALTNNTSLQLDFAALKKEWTDLYPIACTDFTRFLLGWMPSHRKINDYNLNIMKQVLGEL